MGPVPARAPPVMPAPIVGSPAATPVATAPCTAPSAAAPHPAARPSGAAPEARLAERGGGPLVWELRNRTSPVTVKRIALQGLAQAPDPAALPHVLRILEREEAALEDDAMWALVALAAAFPTALVQDSARLDAVVHRALGRPEHRRMLFGCLTLIETLGVHAARYVPAIEALAATLAPATVLAREVARALARCHVVLAPTPPADAV